MDGTPKEIKDKIENRFQVYNTRPLKAKAQKPIKTKTAKTTTTKAETPEPVTTA